MSRIEISEPPERSDGTLSAAKIERSENSHMESLQIKTIKSMFAGMDSDTQTGIIRDLMNTAKINSIIYNESPIRFNGGGMLNPPDDMYRHNFIVFMIPWWSSFLIVLEESYIDECFAVWKLLHRESLGDRYGSIYEDGDWKLCAIGTYDNCPEIKPIQNERDRTDIFESTIFDHAHPNMITLSVHFNLAHAENVGVPDISSWYIRLADVFLSVYNNPEEASIILMFFGYLASDPEKDQLYRTLFMDKFPQHATFNDVIENESEKLSLLFNIQVA